MSEQLKESMSAVFDDEADAFELRRVLDEAADNEALRAQWHRMQLMRDVMRADDTHMRADFRDSLFARLQEIDEEPDSDFAVAGANDSLQLASVTEPAKANQKAGWLGRATGVLVASAAAILVMVNGGLFESDPGFSSAPNSLADVQIENPPQAVPVMYSQATAADQQRQHAFILRHIQQNAMNSGGVASFAKVATFRRQNVRTPQGQSIQPDSAGNRVAPTQNQSAPAPSGQTREPRPGFSSD